MSTLTRKALTSIYNACKLFGSVYKCGAILIGSNNYDYAFSPNLKNQDDPIFKNSIFKNIARIFPEEMYNAMIGIENITAAYKDKATEIILEGNKIYAKSDRNKIFIGNKFKPEDFNKIAVSKANAIIDKSELSSYYKDNENIESVHGVYDSETIERIQQYEAVTLKPDEYSNLGLIVASKLFPNIKKLDVFEIVITGDKSTDVCTGLILAKYGAIDFILILQCLRL